MSMGGGGSTTVQKADPWKGIQPYLTDVYGRAQAQSNVPQQYYPGQTYADLNPMQTQALGDRYRYATGQLPGLTNTAFGALGSQLSPEATPAMSAAEGLTPSTSVALRNVMQSGGAGISQPNRTPQVGITPYTPQIGFQPTREQIGFNPQTPQIGFNPTTPSVGPTPQIAGTDFNLPQNTYAQMMSGQVDQSVYGGLADAMTGRMTRSFTEEVLPNIRDEGILTGAYGGSRQNLATEGATDKLYQNMGDALANLYGGAYNTAMQQRATGAQLATEAGLGVGRTGAERALAQAQLQSQGGIEQARIGRDIQNLMGGLATSQAQLGAGTNELMGRLATDEAGLGMQAQQLAGNLAVNQAQLGMDTQQLASQIGTENAGLVMQAQQLAQAGRQADAEAMLSAAGLSSNLITAGGAQGIQQGDVINKALALSPTLANMGLMQSDITSQIGGVYQQQQQQAINEAMNRYNYNQQAPWQAISNYVSALSGVPTGAFGQTTGTTTQEANPLGNALGMGGMTAGMYAMGMMNPSFAIGLPLAAYLMS